MISIDTKKSLPERSGGLSHRFSMALSGVVLGILLVFSLSVVSYHYFKLQRQLNEQLNETLELAETSLPTTVWQMDYSSMEDILGAILVNDAIASVQIITDGRIAAVKTQLRYKDKNFEYFKDSAKFIVKSVDVKRFGEKVGQFEVAISRGEIKRELIITVVIVIMLALSLCAAILLTSVFITKQYIFKPLVKLEDHAGLIAGGDLEASIDIGGNDEFVKLASSFNLMANQLKISFDTLEQKVKERTADLYSAKSAAEKMSQHLGVVGAEVQALLDNSPVGILFMDFDRVIQRTNREISRITGYSQEELVGDTTRKLYATEELYETVGNSNYTILMEKGFHQVNSEIQTKDGTLVMCYWRGRVIVAEGGMEGVVWNLEDISMRLKMEEELLKVKKLESIGVLAGGIAHDFNNLLLAIIGNISLAQRLAENDNKVYELLSSAQKASLRAKDLTVKLLTFASGGEPIKATESLPELIEKSTSFVLSGSNVKCVFDFANDLWPVSMDKSQINQVIQNLVINADYFMPDGGTMTISCENFQTTSGQIPGLNDGRYVCVKVQDKGTGIIKKNISKVFDPYFSTKEKDSNKGSGLGLSIVHAIIAKHGGKILVDSTPGKGSIFTIFLPAIPEEDTSLSGQGKDLQSKKGRILVMDDEEIIRKVVCEMLTHLGYEAEQASDGNEAITLYEEHRGRGKGYDVVIMDLTIPGGMGGAEAVQKLMTLDPQAKVIVSSGYSHDPILDNYEEFGFCNIVSKPYQLEDLSLVLSKTLSS